MPELDLYFPLDFLHQQAGRVLPLIERIADRSVPQPCGQLLVHECDMTPTLAAFHGQEIGLQVLQRRLHEAILYREVVLFAGEAPVEFGAIAIHLNELPVEVRADIIGEKAPLGAVLAAHRVVHQSCPQAFLRIEPNVFLCEIFGLDLGTAPLYGRRNVLKTATGAIFADILEILPHAV